VILWVRSISWESDEKERKKFPIWHKVLDELPLILLVVFVASIHNYIYYTLVARDSYLFFDIRFLFLLLSIGFTFITIMAFYSLYAHIVIFLEDCGWKKKK